MNKSELGYVVYSTYRIIDDKSIVYLFGRLKNGNSFLAMCPFRQYFYIKKQDIEKAKALFSADFSDSFIDDSDSKAGYESQQPITSSLTPETPITLEPMLDFEENPVIKVTLNKPGDVSDVRKLYEESGIKCYEADIRFTQRFMMDKGIFGCVGLAGEWKKGNYVDRIYESPEIVSAEEYEIKLKYIAIDIETSYDANEIYSFSIYSEDYKEKISEAHIVSNPDKKLKNAVSYRTEKDLLEGFIKRIQELDPDIITGWNVVDFDLVVLQKRIKHYILSFNIGRTDWETKLRLQESFFKDSSVDVPGRLVLDGITLLKMSFISLPDYKLDTAAREFLGEGKIVIENMRENLADIFKNNPEKLIEYNIKDSELAFRIIKEKKLIELTLRKALITGMQLDKVKGSVASLDSLYIREATKKGYVCPTSNYGEREERVKGAFVMESKPGVYDYVIVLDFKSLYPSIVRTFNIDPISHKKSGTIVAPNGARFLNEEGILPEIIRKLGIERDKAKKEKDAVKSNAIKIIMNSFYGVLANPMCRFYNLEMANAITSFGRSIVQETAKLIEKQGYTVLYGDTDSVFVNTKAENIEGAVNVGNCIKDIINTHFTDKIKKENDRISHLVLEYEKTYKAFLLPKLRHAETGAKKRYAGLLMKDGKEKIDITGLEFVRSDWTELAKKLQLELLDRVFHKKEVYEYVKNLVEEIRQGKHNSALVYRKSIRKELEYYTKTTPPHVKAARLLPKLESSIIEYYVTVKGPEPIQLLKNKIDYEHYIEKQIKPIAESILALYGKSFDDIVTGFGQKSLFDY